MDKILKKHRGHWSRKDFLKSSLVGAAILIFSLFLNYSASIYATNSVSNPVTDLLLDHLPVVDTSFFFDNAVVVFTLLMVILFIIEPQYIPFVLKSAALFIIIRSLFLVLTHIAPSPEAISLNPGRILSKFVFGGDLFFSGHTGMPFLMALIFWRQKTLRYLFLASSIIFGFLLLLGHLHYSIDVFAAFFITYTIFNISIWLFEKDYQLFRNGFAVE